MKTRTEIEPGDIPLTVALETVCFLVVKARAFDAKDVLTEPDPGSNPSDDRDYAVLEDHHDDPVVKEIVERVEALSEDEEIDLIALAWLGRGDYGASDWPVVRAEAETAYNRRTAEYLLGMPLVSDYLEEGLSLLGYSCEDEESDRL